MQSSSKGTRIWYWITTSFVAFNLLLGGFWLMISGQSMDTQLMFPLYFWHILGFWKILGGIAILLPRFPLTKEWAYAGIFFNMTGASAVRIFAGHSTAHIVAPLIMCGIALVSWYLRPVSRTVIARG